MDPKDDNEFKVNGQRLKLFLENFPQELEDIQLGDPDSTSWAKRRIMVLLLYSSFSFLSYIFYFFLFLVF